jgi:hypothetical protein
MIRIEFSQAEIEMLQTERYHHPRMHHRVETVYLTALGCDTKS